MNISRLTSFYAIMQLCDSEEDGVYANVDSAELQILMKLFCQNCGICGNFITFASDKR